MIDFDTNTQNAKIQGLSVMVGQLFNELYKANDERADEALEAYKSLRRLLPMHDSERHIGYRAAWKSANGWN